MGIWTIIEFGTLLTTIICFLTGCSEEEDEDQEIIEWKDIIGDDNEFYEEAARSEEVGQNEAFVNEDAFVMCTKADSDPTQMIKMNSDNIILTRREQLNKNDIEVRYNFDRCLSSPEHECGIKQNCRDWIEDQEWKDISKNYDQGEGRENIISNSSYMFCRQYCGIIYFINDGQIVLDSQTEIEEKHVKLKYGLNYELDKDEKFFIAVIAGESIGEGELAWQSIANVIMNRVGSREWSSLKTAREVMEQKGRFQCLSNGGSTEYCKAVEYMENRDGSDALYEQLISVIMPIYHGEVNDITGGAQLYYSPKSMNPPGSVPTWAAYYKRISVPGIDPNEFVFYTGERIK